MFVCAGLLNLEALCDDMNGPDESASNGQDEFHTPTEETPAQFALGDEPARNSRTSTNIPSTSKSSGVQKPAADDGRVAKSGEHRSAHAQVGFIWALCA